MTIRSEGITGEWDRTELRSDDDLAAHRADEFQALALIEHQGRAMASPALPRGVCASCGERCLPAAVYCDAECRADHELQLAARRRNGAPGA